MGWHSATIGFMLTCVVLMTHHTDGMCRYQNRLGLNIETIRRDTCRFTFTQINKKDPSMQCVLMLFLHIYICVCVCVCVWFCNARVCVPACLRVCGDHVVRRHRRHSLPTRCPRRPPPPAQVPFLSPPLSAAAYFMHVFVAD